MESDGKQEIIAQLDTHANIVVVGGKVMVFGRVLGSMPTCGEAR